MLVRQANKLTTTTLSFPLLLWAPVAITSSAVMASTTSSTITLILTSAGLAPRLSPKFATGRQLTLSLPRPFWTGSRPT